MGFVRGVEIWLLIGLALVALACSHVKPSANARGPETTDSTFMTDYERAFEVPADLERKLAQWNAIPNWVKETAKGRQDWLASLHTVMTQAGWSCDLRNIRARILDRHPDFATSRSWDSHSAIFIPRTTPLILTSIAQIAYEPMIPPDSPDPAANMLLDVSKLDGAADHLSLLVGMFKETGYARGASVSWQSPTIVAAMRFIYYHEFAHTMVQRGCKGPHPVWIVPGEGDIDEELAADQFAFATLMTERGHRPELRAEALAGVAFALSLVALREFTQSDGSKYRIRSAVYRMNRILFWIERAIHENLLTNSEAEGARFHWRLLTDIFKRLPTTPSPVQQLLTYIEAGGESHWKVARNEIVQWIAYGDRCLVLARIREAWSAVCGNDRLQAFASFLLKETADIDHIVHLSYAFETCGTQHTLSGCEP